MRLPLGARRAVVILSAALAIPAATAGTATAEPYKSATTTSVEAQPSPAVVNSTVTYTTTVAKYVGCAGGPVAACGIETLPSGTVSLDREGTPIPGCQDIKLVNGTAVCSSKAPSTPGNTTVNAVYGGDEHYAGSIGHDLLQILAPTPVTARVEPKRVPRRGAVTYSATMSGLQVASAGGAGAADKVEFGTAAFFVDGEALAACAKQPVGPDGVASCGALAPAVGGQHTLKVVYSGAKYSAPGSGEASFEVLAPVADAPATVDFGPVTVGDRAARAVALTNSGTAALTVGHAATTGGGFAVGADGCSGATVAPGASCEVQVVFAPGAAGGHGATLAFDHEAAVALSGTGVAAPVAPVKPGATIDPARKPTFAVNVPRGSNARASSVPTLSLPLACPADEECLLDGRLTVERGGARAAAAATTTVARFSKVQVRAGGLKTVKLKLSRAFVKKAQKQGVRRVRATLTINTVLGSGQRITTRQRLTLVLPKAKKAAKKQRVRPRFTG